MTTRVAFRFVSLVILLTGLAACAPVHVRETPAALRAQTEREAQLAPRTHWLIHAHIAVSNGSDGGSGDLEWRQTGGDYAFVVRAPVTGKTWKLSGGDGHAVLEGVDAQPLSDSNPERLLRERLGWYVPLTDLGAWVRGLRTPGKAAELQYDDHDLPAVLTQDGWKVEYRDWFTDRSPPLPRKVFASRGGARVRVAIESWAFDE